jgi:hypothetical protein
MSKIEALQEIMDRTKPLARERECAQLRDNLRRRDLNGLAALAEANRLGWIALHDSIQAGMKSAARFEAHLAGGQSLN